MAAVDLNEEILRSLSARIALADKHTRAAALLLGALRRGLPAPRAENVACAQRDLQAKWAAMPEGDDALPGLGAGGGQGGNIEGGEQ